MSRFVYIFLHYWAICHLQKKLYIASIELKNKLFDVLTFVYKLLVSIGELQKSIELTLFKSELQPQGTRQKSVSLQKCMEFALSDMVQFRWFRIRRNDTSLAIRTHNCASPSLKHCGRLITTANVYKFKMVCCFHCICQVKFLAVYFYISFRFQCSENKIGLRKQSTKLSYQFRTCEGKTYILLYKRSESVI